MIVKYGCKICPALYLSIVSSFVKRQFHDLGVPGSNLGEGEAFCHFIVYMQIYHGFHGEIAGLKIQSKKGWLEKLFNVIVTLSLC